MGPPVRHLQAGHPTAGPTGTAPAPVDRPRTSRPDRVRRQGASGRRPRQGDDQGDRPGLPLPGTADADGLHRGLRHGGSPHALPGRRRVAEHAPPSPRGLRHERHESGAERGAELLDPGRLARRALRRGERLGHQLERGPRGPGPAGRRRGITAVRPAREPDRPALLRPADAGADPASMDHAGQGIAGLVGPAGLGVAHGARLRHPDLRTPGRPGHRARTAGDNARAAGPRPMEGRDLPLLGRGADPLRRHRRLPRRSGFDPPGDGRGVGRRPGSGRRRGAAPARPGRPRRRAGVADRRRHAPPGRRGVVGEHDLRSPRPLRLHGPGGTPPSRPGLVHRSGLRHLVRAVG